MTSPDRRSRLPYWPALDGLRGLAVIAVLLYHQGFSWAGGGFLGVSLFFTLSGFLITSLLVAEWDSTGRIGLRAFWGRRLRRLAPAGLLGLALALVVTYFAVPGRQVGEAIGDIRSALAYVTNWRFIVLGAPYADLFRVPSPVQHFWSLAIEEQFYLVFPVLSLLALRRGKGTLAAALIAVTGLSFVLQLRFGATDRTYYGTDTRAAELAIGGLFALGYPRLTQLRALHRWKLPDVGGFVALGATLLLWSQLSLSKPSLYQGGFVAVGGASVLLLLGALDGAPLRAALSVRPLVWVGRVSYGIYVFHFPLYLLLSADRIGVSGWTLFGVRVAATVGLAAVSVWLIERPVRERRALVRPTVALPAFLVTAAVVAFLTFPASTVPPTTGRLATAGRTSPTVPTTIPAPATTAPEATPSSTPSTVVAVTAPTPPPAPAPTAPVARRAPRIVVLGDSTALANGAGMSDWGARNGQLEVDQVNALSCPVLHGDLEHVRQGFDTPLLPGCAELIDTAVSEARRVDADAFVVFIGSAQLCDWRYRGEQQFRSIEDPAVAAWYLEALNATLTKLATVGIPILWADVPVPNWDLDKSAKIFGGVYPGTGAPTMNSPTRTAVLNQIDSVGLAAHPQAARFPYASFIQGPVDPRPDGLHLDTPTMARLMDNGLRDALMAAYRKVVTTAASGIGVRGITWAP